MLLQFLLPEKKKKKINRKRISVYQALFLRAGYQASQSDTPAKLSGEVKGPAVRGRTR